MGTSDEECGEVEVAVAVVQEAKVLAPVGAVDHSNCDGATMEKERHHQGRGKCQLRPQNRHQGHRNCLGTKVFEWQITSPK